MLNIFPKNQLSQRVTAGSKRPYVGDRRSMVPIITRIIII